MTDNPLDTVRPCVHGRIIAWTAFDHSLDVVDQPNSSVRWLSKLSETCRLTCVCLPFLPPAVTFHSFLLYSLSTKPVVLHGIAAYLHCRATHIYALFPAMGFHVYPCYLLANHLSISNPVHVSLLQSISGISKCTTLPLNTKCQVAISG